MTVNTSDGNRLSGHNAAKALDKYIKKLEKRKVKGRTEEQVITLIKTAKVLRAAVIQANSEKAKPEILANNKVLRALFESIWV